MATKAKAKGQARRVPRRLSIQERSHAMTLTRAAIQTSRLVYILCANRQHRYPTGPSKIVYIGSTKNGAGRIAQSLAHHAARVLKRWGFTSVTAHVVATGGRGRIQTWRTLERGLLLSFKDSFGDKPICNVHGKSYRWRDEQVLFRGARLSAIVAKYSE